MVASDPRAEERVGSVLHDKWTLERLLGVGGMGAVYAARHRNGARAAVKILSPSSGRQPHVRDRFLREGYAANRVEHAGAVKVLDDDVIHDGPDEGTAYLVMELLEGESLHDRAKREPPLDERDLLEIADGVLAVLDAAHTNGVVHRDLKPDNLFLVRDAERGASQVKVLDFGLARLLESREQTIAGMAIGTPTYMSPEQAAGHVDEIDGRTDLYALGAILFQLVSNKRIHDAAHTLGLVVRMATTPAPKLRTVAPDVSEGFARVVDRALEFKREDRYPTAAAMRVDVKAALDILEGEGLGAALAVRTEVAPAKTLPALADTVRLFAGGVASTSVEPSVGDVARRPSRRRTIGGLVVGGALAVAGLAGVKARGFDGLTASAESSAAPRGLAPSTMPSAAALAVNSSPNDGDLAAAARSVDDASADEDADASLEVDRGAASADEEGAFTLLDGGDDEEDDEDDEDLDAGAPDDASLPAPASNGATGPRRSAPHVAKSAPKKKKKKKKTRRPGSAPRRKKWGR